MKKPLAKGAIRPNRRQVLVGAASSLTAGFFRPTNAKAMLPLADLDDMAAEEALRIAAGRSVRLRMLIPEGSQGNIEPVIAAFNERTGIIVEIEVTDVDDINTKLLLDQMAGNKDYDVALPATFGIPELAEAGALFDISEFALAYEPEALRVQSLYSIGDSYDGRLYGFQADGDAYLMFYNKPWLDNDDNQKRYADQFGQRLAIPETWQELDRQMAFFHEPGRNHFGGALFRTPTYVVWEWWIRFHAKGSWPFDDEMTPLIDGEAGVLALEELIAASASLHPGASNAGLFDNWKSYGQGNIYANIGWGGTQKYLNGPLSMLRNKLAFGMTPGGVVDGKKLVTPYFNWGWNYVVVRQSKEKEIAYLLALFASSPKQSTKAVSDPKGYFDPHRPEHYQDQAIIDAYSTPFLNVHKTSMHGVIPDLYVNGHGEYFGALREGIIAALEGRKDAATALNETAKSWTIITHRLGSAKQREQWRALRSKYPKNIANRLKPRLKAG